MPSEVIHDTETITVWFDPGNMLVRHKIKKFIYGDDFWTGLAVGADKFVEKGCRKYLSDDENSSALRDEDVQWADEHWQSKMQAGGLKYWAIVTPTKIVGRLPFKRITERYRDLGVTVQMFDNADDAFAWLVAQQ